eukprot:TRINITY_DN14665_c0_g2_i1.p1 TRINITY_DN14665_c0_g2~~TRINITY_DN14665_c0_g2_i1.p1  ORF type:complete len:357 (+),score=42.33 TRINITY_DN14665_c0_g2_i1:55-1125(+)
MSVSAVSSQLRSVLATRDREHLPAGGIQSAVENVGKLGPRERFELVVGHPWGELILARLLHDDREDVFRLLSLLTDVRPPPPARQNFYASFDCPGLCEACVAQLRDAGSGQHAVVVRNCIRNFARNPPFRLRCSSAVSLLAASLEDSSVQGTAKLEIAAANAAALCNICCDNAFKAEAVNLGVVQRLLHYLKLSPTFSVAEDLVACVGVLTANYPPGMESLFQSGDAGVIVACLFDRGSSSLQVLAAEVLGDICSCSKSFTSWLVNDSELLEAHMGHLLSISGDPQLLNAALKLCNRLAEADGFAKAVQKGSTVNALQAIAELPEERRAPDVDWDERRPPTKQEEAKALLGKILFF